jgi:hypothetical protein
VRTADDSHRAGCQPVGAGERAEFQFGAGDEEEGERVVACLQGYDDLCRSAVNGPEKEPTHIYHD